MTEIEELRERMREAAKLNMKLMDIRRDNEAEIERLRDQVTRLSTLVDTERSLHDVEIERLRGLLNEFWECADADTEYWDLQGGYHKELRQRVRKALGE